MRSNASHVIKLKSFQVDELKPSPYSYSKSVSTNLKIHPKRLRTSHASKTTAPVHEGKFALWSLCTSQLCVHFCKIASGISSKDWRNMAIPQSQGLNLFSECRSRAKIENIPRIVHEKICLDGA